MNLCKDNSPDPYCHDSYGSYFLAAIREPEDEIEFNKRIFNSTMHPYTKDQAWAKMNIAVINMRDIMRAMDRV